MMKSTLFVRPARHRPFNATNQLAPIYHWRMAAHCLWKTMPDYTEAMQLELAALQRLPQKHAGERKPRPDNHPDRRMQADTFDRRLFGARLPHQLRLNQTRQFWPEPRQHQRRFLQITQQRLWPHIFFDIVFDDGLRDQPYVRMRVKRSRDTFDNNHRPLQQNQLGPRFHPEPFGYLK